MQTVYSRLCMHISFTKECVNGTSAPYLELIIYTYSKGIDKLILWHKSNIWHAWVNPYKIVIFRHMAVLHDALGKCIHLSDPQNVSWHIFEIYHLLITAMKCYSCEPPLLYLFQFGLLIWKRVKLSVWARNVHIYLSGQLIPPALFISLRVDITLNVLCQLPGSIFPFPNVPLWEGFLFSRQFMKGLNLS